MEDENWFFADGIGHFQTYLTNLARLQALHVVLYTTPRSNTTKCPYSKHNIVISLLKALQTLAKIWMTDVSLYTMNLALKLKGLGEFVLSINENMGTGWWDNEINF